MAVSVLSLHLACCAHSSSPPTTHGRDLAPGSQILEGAASGLLNPQGWPAAAVRSARTHTAQMATNTKADLEALLSKLMTQLFELEGMMADFSADSSPALLEERL